MEEYKKVYVKENYMSNILEDIKKNGETFIKDNATALIGAVVGYLVSNDEKAKSAILGAVAGKVLVDKKEK